MKTDVSTHLVPTWSMHSVPRSLLVAVVLAIAPFLAVLALTYPVLAGAFLAGAAVAVLAATEPGLRRRLGRDGRAALVPLTR